MNISLVTNKPDVGKMTLQLWMLVFVFCLSLNYFLSMLLKTFLYVTVVWVISQCLQVRPRRTWLAGRIEIVITNNKIVNLYCTTRVWDEALLNEAVTSLMDEFPLASNVPGGMPEYRRLLVGSLFFKFYWSVTSRLKGTV